MTLQAFQSLQESGSFKEYPELVAAAIGLLPIAGPMAAVTIIIALSVIRGKLRVKQDNAEDKGKISVDDKSKYSPKNSNNTAVSKDTAVSSPDTTVSSSNTGGNNPEEDYSKFLERYIDDLYNAGTDGDNMLREAGLNGLVDNNWTLSVEEAVQVFAEFMNNFNF